MYRGHATPDRRLNGHVTFRARFAISPNEAPGPPDAQAGARANDVAATLQVAVVDRMVVKAAIRNVRARDAQGNMRFHAKRPCDPAKEVAQMNAIWRPQTNIVFELVPSTDIDVDHRAHSSSPKNSESPSPGAADAFRNRTALLGKPIGSALQRMDRRSTGAGRAVARRLHLQEYAPAFYPRGTATTSRRWTIEARTRMQPPA